ncbi:MAG: hemolysin III family protein [Thermodesulfobacteriota bacterium]|nr:hemolysin III family protein [Thermodesulfobacteriota bacterium]
MKTLSIMKLKDPMSGLTHFIGALLAAAGLILLLDQALHPLQPWYLFTYLVFGLGLIGMYTASTLYHWLILSPTGTERLRRIDHIMIFILIAATYTPICLIPLRGPWGWSIFGTIWGLAVIGIIFKLFWIDSPRWITAAMYVAMGWVAIVAIYPMIKGLQTGALIWIVAGGLIYTLGALIYATKRPDPFPGLFGFHEVFHIMVILGSLAHFWAIYCYI